MKWFFRFLVLLLLVIGWALATLSVHVVRGTSVTTGQDRWVFLPKSRLGITDTYADVRAWKPTDLPPHEPLVRRLIDSGKSDVLTSLVPAEQRGDIVKFLREALLAPPTTQDSR